MRYAIYANCCRVCKCVFVCFHYHCVFLCANISANQLESFELLASKQCMNMHIAIYVIIMCIIIATWNAWDYLFVVIDPRLVIKSFLFKLEILSHYYWHRIFVSFLFIRVIRIGRYNSFYELLFLILELLTINVRLNFHKQRILRLF